MTKTEVLPCPFCGEKAEIFVGTVLVSCSVCGAEIKSYNADEEEAKRLAIEHWNTRVYPPEVQDAIDRNAPNKVISSTFLSKGEEYEVYRCPKCKNGLDACREKFCPNCGQRLDWE